jgi:PPK2 family polyphosphate:nucleotide phosphotransferase
MFLATPGKRIKLRNFDPAFKDDFASQEQAQAKLQHNVEQLAKYQDLLYSDQSYSLLLIFQAMDAAGKDGTIKHVMSGVNPEGCEVYSFKSPSSEELRHDFLWRTYKALPERGRIGIFNRSYYEEVLVVRVHPELLEKQKLPPHLVTKRIWDERFEDIQSFERYLSRNGVMIRKFFLHVSEEEQKRRFLDRLSDPEKYWKFSAADAQERGFWKDYMKAYEDAIQHTATVDAPWYVVPADNKWFTRVVVAAAIIDSLVSMDLSYPEVSKEKLAELAEAKKILLAQK